MEFNSEFSFDVPFEDDNFPDAAVEHPQASKSTTTRDGSPLLDHTQETTPTTSSNSRKSDLDGYEENKPCCTSGVTSFEELKLHRSLVRALKVTF